MKVHTNEHFFLILRLKRILDFGRVFLRKIELVAGLAYPVQRLSNLFTAEDFMIPKQLVFLYVACVITLFVVNAFMG